MSKEIAQTVGGKRVLWLLAILAAFAALASVLVNTRDAKATVTGPVTINGPFSDTLCAVPVAAVTAGATVYFCIDGGPEPTIVAPLQITATVGPNFRVTSVGQLAGPQPSPCTITGGNVAGNGIDCSYPGINAASTFRLRLTTIASAPVPGVVLAAPLPGFVGVADDPSNGTLPLVNATTALDIATSNVILAKTAAGTGAAGTNITYTIAVTNPLIAAVVGVNPATVAAANVVISDIVPTAISLLQNVTISGVGNSCVPNAGFPIANSPQVTVVCTIPALAVAGAETITITGTVGATATGSFTNTATGTATSQPTIVASSVTNGTAAANILAPGLYHVSADGLSLLTIRDQQRNAIGFNHTVCLVDSTVTIVGGVVTGVAQGTIGPALAAATGGIQPPNTTGVRWRIEPLSGGANVNGQAKVLRNFTQYTNGGNAQGTLGNTSLNCVTWYSTNPGEQNVTVVDNAGQVIADFADDTVSQTLGGAPVAVNGLDTCPLTGTAPALVCAAPINAFTPLVKEWNTIDFTVITRRGVAPLTSAGVAQNNLHGTTVTAPATFNPGTSAFIATEQLFDEHVFGSHQSVGGVVGPVALNGALVTFARTGTCGSVVIDPTTVINLTATTFVTIGVPVKFAIRTATNCVSLNNSTTGVTFTSTYLNNLGSINPAPIVETVTVRWVAQLPAKQVFLAWAGQRIILEHDWRLPAGDVDGGASTSPAPLAQFCPYDDEEFFLAKFIKGSGPGNFLPGFSAEIGDLDLLSTSADEAIVATASDITQNDSDIDANSACISRVGYESEDPGEVDIEVFGPSGTLNERIFDNQSKVAFVVYYMKLNTVKLGIVGSVSKPTHNSSLAGWTDFAPGNPWDASKDVTTIDWNVSRDLLIRGRVQGWFKNTNPSGRAADTTDPNNVLPADRWVLPNDWALLAGGPADPADGTDASGTAEQFRPYYDIMIAPNNARGLALVSPTGVGVQQVATVVSVPASFTNTANSFIVSTLQNLTVGSSVLVGAETLVRTVVSNTGVLTLSASATGVVPAAGTPVFLVNGTPFEGPYSLLDIADLTNTGTLADLGGAGAGSAALSNLDPNNVRDTIWQDGDVDMWDAPMPPALVSVRLRGTGFMKQVIKSDVYYNGTPNSAAQNYPNPFYIVNIPDSPFLSAVQAGGGYDWDSWGLDGPGGAGQGVYSFWQQVYRDQNSAGIGEALTAAERTELAAIRTFFGDSSITRDMVIYSDNHGEFMVAANGDFKTDLSACATNVLGGGKHCKPGDKVGTGTVTATADYPDFRGKHFPVASNSVTANWTWGGYKDVTVEAGEDPQFKYVVFHGMDRDGFCNVPFAAVGQVSLHPVLSAGTIGAGAAATDAWTGITAYPAETVDFLIDSGEGIILNGAFNGTLNTGGNRQFATGVKTFSTGVNDPATTGIKEFPLSALAAAGATDECQAWIRVSNSLLGILNVLVIAHDDEGDITFDRIIDLQNTATYTLNFRWSLVTWSGADNIPVNDALKGSGANDAGNDISDVVTAVYGWDAAAQDWLGFFPEGVNVPGANDLVSLKNGSAYWIAIKAPGPTTWTIATNVGR
ncbi:MAG: hypothetical protein ACKVT1_16795 [Dehalococcoidia bacterium]